MFIKTKILFIFILILTFIFNTKNVFGINYFYDNFDQNNLDNWTFINVNSNENGWKIINNKLVGEVGRGGSSFLLAKSFWNLSNYSINVDVLNESGVDQNIVFRISEDRKEYYILDIRYKDPYWTQDGGQIVLMKYNSVSGYTVLNTFNKLDQINLIQNQVHKIEIKVDGFNIKIYFDSVLIIDFNDLNPVLNGSFGFFNWGGDYYKRSTKNLFDNLIVSDFNLPIITPTETPIPTPTLIQTPTPTEIPTPTPTEILTPTPTLIPTLTITPTPIPIPKTKIIIIPGLGASWNSEAIVYNKSVGNDQWKMTPFVNNYDGLINGLKQNGLKENEDFYVWNYDWRRPLADIVVNLNTFINQKVASNEKVILVGHSLGGVTSRIWAEDNRNDSRLEKIITLASPHLGSVDGYEVWNGGQISDLSNISSIAFKILLKIQGLNQKSDMAAARKYSPIIKDLLPTFDFVKKNGVVLSNDKLETKNTFLISKNQMASVSAMKLFSGKDYKTMNSIELTNNGLFDKVLGIWLDGRIKNTLYINDGDGTVLTKSANYKGNNFVEISSNHGDIVNKTINQVMMEIGLSQVNVITESQDFSNSVVVFVGSPVNYSVKCDNDSPVLENDGFVIIKNKNYQNCNVNFVGTGSGLMHVVAGNTNDTNWSYWEKNVVVGEVGSVKINPKSGQIINDKNNVLFLKSMIKADIELLLVFNKNDIDLKNALKFLNKNQFRLLIESIFSFRLRKNEIVVSQKVIENSTTLMSLTNTCSKNLATYGFKKVDGYKGMIGFLVSLNNKKISNSEYVAMSYQKMDNLLKTNKIDIDKKDYSNVCANNFVAVNYGTEVLIKNFDFNSVKKWLVNDSDL